MDLYERIRGQLLDLPRIQDWPELQMLLCNAVAARPRHWLLPMVACEAVGGTAAQALPGTVAFACLQTAILVVDDMLDADPRGVHNGLGFPITSNLASALQAAGMGAVASSDCPIEVRLVALHCLNQMILSTALGQHWDVQNREDEATYWHIIRTKSAPFFGAGLYIGALMGGATVAIATQLHKVGELYGEMIQISDDLKDVMENPASPDWTEGRASLPILFAQSVEHAERNRFQQLRRLVSNPDALAEAQTIIIRCGAVSYTAYQLLGYYRQVQRILDGVSLVHPHTIYQLFEEVIAPTRSLLTQAMRRNGI